MGMYNEAASVQDVALALAHEVKNPLSLVRANIDLLELDDPGEDHKRQYRIMKRELDKINEIVHDLIGLTVPEADLDDVPLSGLLRGLINPYRETYEPDIRFILDAASETRVKGSAARLSLVFNNLLKNAVEAIQAKELPGPGLVRISISSSPSGDTAVITFRDNGIGLSDEAGTIGRPFYTTKQNGTGVGLYSSRTIVAQHGGTLAISGGRDGGCVVEVRLPCV